MPGPYISEVKYRGPASQDFVEVAVDEGTSVATLQVAVYHPNGNLRSLNSLGSLDGNQFGKDIYSITTGVHKDGAIALVDNGVVLSFISFDSVVSTSKGPAAGLTSTQVGSTGNNQNMSLVSNDGGTFTTQSPPSSGTIPCFLRGTRILTVDGYRNVQSLKAGDSIIRAEGGAVALRWIGKVCLTDPDDVAANAPVRIPKHSLGPNIPKRDLLVSPNHRLFFSAPEYELYFSEREVLIPAKHLVGWRGIKTAAEFAVLEYHHLLFDKHEIILSEGLPSESFHPGDMVLDAMGRETRDELLALFPSLAGKNKGYGQTARTCLTVHEAEILRKLSA